MLKEQWRLWNGQKKINSFASKNSPELIKKGENAKKYYFKHFSSLIRKKEILNLIYE